MAFMLFSIEDAVDSKYIVTKSMRQQAKKGTLIHVMDAGETSDGITVKYRVTKTKQDFTAHFDTIKQFCSWCMPSSFLAKYYDKLSTRDILTYIRVENRSFLTFHLPLILICLAIVWAVAMFVVKDMVGVLIGVIIGAASSIIVIVAVLVISHIARTQMIEHLYRKVS